LCPFADQKSLLKKTLETLLVKGFAAADSWCDATPESQVETSGHVLQIVKMLPYLQTFVKLQCYLSKTLEISRQCNSEIHVLVPMPANPQYHSHATE